MKKSKNKIVVFLLLMIFFFLSASCITVPSLEKFGWDRKAEEVAEIEKGGWSNEDIKILNKIDSWIRNDKGEKFDWLSGTNFEKLSTTKKYNALLDILNQEMDSENMPGFTYENYILGIIAEEEFVNKAYTDYNKRTYPHQNEMLIVFWSDAAFLLSDIEIESVRLLLKKKSPELSPGADSICRSVKALNIYREYVDVKEVISSGAYNFSFARYIVSRDSDSSLNDSWKSYIYIAFDFGSDEAEDKINRIINATENYFNELYLSYRTDGIADHGLKEEFRVKLRQDIIKQITGSRKATEKRIKEWFFETIKNYIDENEKKNITQDNRLKNFLEANEKYFTEQGIWEEINKEIQKPGSFACISFGGRSSIEQCKALINFYVYYILGKKQWLYQDKNVMNPEIGLRLSNDSGETVIKLECKEYDEDKLRDRVQPGDVFFIYVNPSEGWGHYGIIYDVKDNGILVLDGNRNFDGILRIGFLQELIEDIESFNWQWIEISRFD
jgi:hypothetical protein